MGNEEYNRLHALAINVFKKRQEAQVFICTNRNEYIKARTRLYCYLDAIQDSQEILGPNTIKSYVVDMEEALKQIELNQAIVDALDEITSE